MRKLTLLLLAVAAVLVAGCSSGSGGPPRATSPELTYDFGDVPVTADMKHHTFTIRNEGGADLKLSDLQVKLLQGC